jgi:hypothetical protein
MQILARAEERHAKREVVKKVIESVRFVSVREMRHESSWGRSLWFCRLSKAEINREFANVVNKCCIKT